MMPSLIPNRKPCTILHFLQWPAVSVTPSLLWESESSKHLPGPSQHYQAHSLEVGGDQIGRSPRCSLPRGHHTLCQPWNQPNNTPNTELSGRKETPLWVSGHSFSTNSSHLLFIYTLNPRSSWPWICKELQLKWFNQLWRLKWDQPNTLIQAKRWMSEWILNLLRKGCKRQSNTDSRSALCRD